LIDTPRLRLLASSPGHLLALMDGTQSFQELSGLTVADGLREMFTSGEVSPQWLEQLRAAKEPNPWMHGFHVILRESNVVIGSVGFKGPPDGDGMVEIAYGIAPSFQGRGYATEAATAGVSFAFQDPSVSLVRAHTLPTNNASTRVLTKCGFRRVGEVIDPEDGLVWRWERQRGENE